MRHRRRRAPLPLLPGRPFRDPGGSALRVVRAWDCDGTVVLTEEAPVGSTYRLVVSGSMPSAVIGIVQDRFEDVRVGTSPGRLVIDCSIPDQAALRALLIHVWDVGGVVVLVAVMSTGHTLGGGTSGTGTTARTGSDEAERPSPLDGVGPR